MRETRGEYWGDLLLFGGVAGAVAAPLKLIVHHIFEWTHLAKPFYTALNAYLIFGHHQVKGFVESLFVEMGDIAIGAMFGILVSFILRHSRPRYHWWLGAGLGFSIWYFSLAFGNLTKIIRPQTIDPWSLFAHLLAMLAFGLLIVLASRIWPSFRAQVVTRPGT
ncbi:MAG: hypothetical protein ACM3X6_04020 [Patescibacteria group bacterium]